MEIMDETTGLGSDYGDFRGETSNSNTAGSQTDGDGPPQGNAQRKGMAELGGCWLKVMPPHIVVIKCLSQSRKATVTPQKPVNYTEAEQNSKMYTHTQKVLMGQMSRVNGNAYWGID